MTAPGERSEELGDEMPPLLDVDSSKRFCASI
jgi:hypothetical protein